ncbi:MULTISPECIES: hypothetical protein [Saccharothrix]|uniref:hypothetical protein n=1 Tax=Saccharothrix TaxID=2071 RepID=UPI001F51FE8A|nr:hypothetical protein [Saccharothrix sp. CB00851]
MARTASGDYWSAPSRPTAIFRELEDALRPPPSAVPGVELAVHYQPAGEDTPTGGDL